MDYSYSTLKSENAIYQALGDMSEEAKEPLEEISIESRFGTIVVKLENALFFPQGLLGLPDNLHFCLTDIPKKGMGNFKLLQCLNDHSLSFVVLPLNSDNQIIDKEDLDECCEIIGIEVGDLLALLIVSVQRSPDGAKVTANVRAPIVIDVKKKAAMQYVFPNSKYEICQKLIS